jgi:hypothetical protein
MGFLSAPSAPAAPPPPPPVPPAANPPTYASSAVQAGGQRRAGAAVGAGFEGSLFTGPQGAAAGPAATPGLSGIATAAVKDKLGT